MDGSRAARPGLRAALAVAVLVLSAQFALVGSLGLSIPVVMLALALVIIDVSTAAGLAGAGALLALGAAIALVSGSPPWFVLFNTVGVGVVLGVGVALGVGEGVTVGDSVAKFAGSSSDEPDKPVKATAPTPTRTSRAAPRA